MSRRYRQVSITLGDEDIKLLEELTKKKGWDRSRAMRFMLRRVGKILLYSDIVKYEEAEEEANEPESDVYVVDVPRGKRRILLRLE